MNSPFGSSNQGGFRQQPQQQNFSQQGGFGVQTAGTFGGFQPQQQSFGFGGGQGFGGFQPQQSFGGFGGGQGFGGFNPFQGGFGGFQPQQQFNPFQGGYGGGFQPQGFGGGFNPMFGGIGGLGFNPMMGPQFGMPMQGFNPYQIQMMDKQRQFEQQQFNADQTPVMGDMMYRGGRDTRADFRDMRNAENEVSHFGLWGGTGEYDPKTGQIDLGRPRPPAAQPQSPFTGPQMSARDILNMAVGNTPKDMQYDLNKDGKITSADALAYQRQYGQQPQTPQIPVDSGMNRGVDNMSIGPGFGSRQPMYGGIGGLGFNPMMGPQFGMPMQGMGGYGGFNPYQPPQQREQLLQDQKRFGYGQDLPQMPMDQGPGDYKQMNQMLENMQKEGARNKFLSTAGDLSFDAFQASEREKARNNPYAQFGGQLQPPEYLKYRNWLQSKSRDNPIAQEELRNVYNKYLGSKRQELGQYGPQRQAQLDQQSAQEAAASGAPLGVQGREFTSPERSRINQAEYDRLFNQYQDVDADSWSRR